MSKTSQRKKTNSRKLQDIYLRGMKDGENGEMTVTYYFKCAQNRYTLGFKHGQRGYLT